MLYYSRPGRDLGTWRPVQGDEVLWTSPPFSLVTSHSVGQPPVQVQIHVQSTLATYMYTCCILLVSPSNKNLDNHKLFFYVLLLLPITYMYHETNQLLPAGQSTRKELLNLHLYIVLYECRGTILWRWLMLIKSSKFNQDKDIYM